MKGGQIGVTQKPVWTLLTGEKNVSSMKKRITQVGDQIDTLILDVPSFDCSDITMWLILIGQRFLWVTALSLIG